MKSILVLILTTCLFACTKPKEGHPAPSSNPIPIKTEGGVDVGNLTTAMVPRTHASISYPNTWKSEDSKQSLILQNGSGSVIQARKSEISEISSPSALSLQQYLKTKFPEREYKILKLNGMEGVRADLVDSSSQKKSDIYLVSELKDFIHIESDLKSADDGISKGETIISTVRVKYQGVPYENSQVKSVTLKARENNESHWHAYSFSDDCYSYGKECNQKFARGVGVAYERYFQIGTAGYDHGRIVELGPETQIPFDSIKVEGEYLVAPLSNILISDIYTAFTPKNPQVDQSRIQLKKGYVYLVRTIRWPEEDLITKMRVEDLVEGKSVRLTYQKLVYVKEDELKKQVDAINKYTIENEQPLVTGEVTLYNRSVWDNYYYASFNFQFSTSGNMFITRNGWDLLLSGGPRDNTPTFGVPHTGSGIGEVIDIGKKDLNLVTLSDFPDPNQYKRDWGPEAKIGHTYIVYHFDYDEPEFAATYGAVQVLDRDPEGKWVRMKFRRIYNGPAPHFQKWINLEVPKEVQSVTLEGDWASEKAIFYPFIGKRGDQGSHYHERLYFGKSGPGEKSYLLADNRPYGNDRGFHKLKAGTSIHDPTLESIEKLKGQFRNEAEFSEGDVYALYLENFNDKTVLVFKVEKEIPGHSVTLSIKYLFKAKTPYSNDQE